MTQGCTESQCHNCLHAHFWSFHIIFLLLGNLQYFQNVLSLFMSDFSSSKTNLVLKRYTILCCDQLPLKCCYRTTREGRRSQQNENGVLFILEQSEVYLICKPNFGMEQYFTNTNARIHIEPKYQQFENSSVCWKFYRQYLQPSPSFQKYFKRLDLKCLDLEMSVKYWTFF